MTRSIAETKGDPLRWHILTGEYPPKPGGVADYTALLAAHLSRAGDDVQVWFPASCGTEPGPSGVNVHPLPGNFGPQALRILGRALGDDRQPFRLLVQYAPHAYGYKGMNLFFANWLRRMQRFAPWIMFHEVAFPIERAQPLRHRVLAEAQQLMVRRIAKSVARCFISVPVWNERLRNIAPGIPEGEWLPDPSNLPDVAECAQVERIRRRYLGESGTRLIGHFGTYGVPIANAVGRTFSELLAREPAWTGLLMGRGSGEFAREQLRVHPELKGRLHATGNLPASEQAAHLAATDVLFQPFPDGITSRRGSAMAGLALGLPLVTTRGALTEPIWETERLVAFADAGSGVGAADALAYWSTPSIERSALMLRAHDGYRRFFGWERVIETLRR